MQENPSAAGAPPWTTLGSLQRSPRPSCWWGWELAAPSPETPTPPPPRYRPFEPPASGLASPVPHSKTSFDAAERLLYLPNNKCVLCSQAKTRRLKMNLSMRQMKNRPPADFLWSKRCYGGSLRIWTSANRTSAVVANFQHRQRYTFRHASGICTAMGPIQFMLYTTDVVTVIERRGLSVLITHKFTVAVILMTSHRSIASLVAALSKLLAG